MQNHCTCLYIRMPRPSNLYFARLPPCPDVKARFLIALQTHPWSIVDAETGALVKEVVAEAGSQSIPIQEPEDLASRLEIRSQAELQAVAAFDGVGGPSDNYAPAQVTVQPHQRTSFQLPWSLPFRFM